LVPAIEQRAGDPRAVTERPNEAGARWHWAPYRDWVEAGCRSAPAELGSATSPGWRVLALSSYVEWRYYAVLAPAFSGMVGLALFNPKRLFPTVAEGGLLLIISGVLDPEAASGGADWSKSASPVSKADPDHLCWMHLFAPEACAFDAAGPGTVDAEDGQCRLRLRSPTRALAQLDLQTAGGLSLQLSHRGAWGLELPPASDAHLDGLSGRLTGSHWRVTCPSPMARCDGVLRLSADALDGLADKPGGVTDSYASPALRDRVGAGGTRFRWRGASGYAEHSYGVRPLPLQGWEFLFVPSAEAGQAVVLQTYRGSRVLRYLEVCWVQDGVERHHRFSGEHLRIDWSEVTFDPVLGVRRPLKRRVEARDAGLTLRLDNRILHRIPLLRRERLAVRHFFISEEVGVADWQLTDAAGSLLASGVAQPCGGELAHLRLLVPGAQA
jgi:hypothetical protein